MRAPPLPIDPLLAPLQETLDQVGCAVVIAPPGAGKTTAIPLALLSAPWRATEDRILLLEPRRLAARAAAERMADLLGEPLGERVGLRTRTETRTSPRTRIEVITEGVLTRMLIRDPELSGVSTLLFDEFHERSLQADTGLALALECRNLFRPDLRLAVLSATLEGESVAALLGPDAVILRSEGRSFPVETQYRERPLPPPGLRVPGRPSWEDAVAGTIRMALDQSEGDILVFLPGAREIRWIAARLSDLGADSGIAIHVLHGSLAPEAQRAAMAPAPEGARKVILSSAIAETSLTLPGVRVVVDGGWMRVPRFNPTSGWTRLETVPVTLDAADQRRGRAGRVAHGTCYRLWTREEERGRPSSRRAEIAEADLAPLLLDLGLWGARPEDLRWLTPPPEASLAQARTTLRHLGLMDPHREDLTDAGRKVADLGLHPRLGRLLLAAQAIGHLDLGCALAALLEERDVLVGVEGPADADLRLRLEALDRAPALPLGVRVDRGALARVRKDQRHWRQRVLRAGSRGMPERSVDWDDDVLGILCARGWPDRVARHSGGGRYQLASGRGARLTPDDRLAGSSWLVAVDVDDRGGDARILQAAPLDPELFQTSLADMVRAEEEVRWNDEAGRVEALRVWRVGEIELRQARLDSPDPDVVTRVLCMALRTRGLGALAWTSEATRVRERLAFLHQVLPDRVQSVDDSVLLDELERWLIPMAPEARSLSCLADVDLAEALLSRETWEIRSLLDRMAPSHWHVPSGSRIPIDYTDPLAPVLAVRIQEVFGLQTTPTVADGRVPLMLHLLSPARRPVQVTRDLESFWATGYFDVRKDLRGRYPKHFWPDDPLKATATHRVRPKPGGAGGAVGTGRAGGDGARGTDGGGRE
jgi:ATP-dependent helicase HrpB